MNYDALKMSGEETQYTCAGLPPCPNCGGNWLMVAGGGRGWDRIYTCSCRSCGQTVRYSQGLAFGQPLTNTEAGRLVDAEFSKRRLREL